MLPPSNSFVPKELKEFEGYKCPTGLPASYLPYTAPAYVFVSGSHGNPWGHCLLKIDDAIGYVHAAQPGWERTLFLPNEEFDRYLLESKKVVWETKPIQFKADRIEAARLLTNQFMTKGFLWVPWHDCVTMADEIATAGGSAYIANTVFPDNAVAAIRKANNPPPQEPSLFKKLFPNW
jgi:hypothetical protein